MGNAATEIAPGVAYLSAGIANSYFIGDPGSAWVLIDTGVPKKADAIQEAAGARFGETRPTAILLTHGHFDHAGNALELAHRWDIPIYTHRLELPYLTGKSPYPPKDPTAPGFMSFLSRFFTTEPLNLGNRLRVYETGVVPGLPDWQWYHTPGHAPGHVSFFRASDATLVAGDAFATANLDSLFGAVSKRRRISRPPVPFTCDWLRAAESVRRLDELNPLTFACGHGDPMSGPDAADEFSRFVSDFPVPSHGRYVERPARTDENGIVSLPPAPADPVPGAAGALGIAAITGLMFVMAAKKRRRLLSA